ncbi:amidase [Acutalibacter sp. 1XD8-33]|uniref:N-acetylmuramoyl-L-alanine amidase n=1 Tax=Acutalibacter sp. 1XD8-33 TaxID=2320081 RepID=UPI000EA33928|nr:N-acetylmuramoyl-L-alanine amidase [Acutalibacter sp. 1XD8-33]RKJ41918.1 amidase [Acutalibacter sp. 1XD8-33]
MSNSPLSCMRLISPNRNSPRNHDTDTLTPHCAVGQMSVEALCNEFSRTSKGASCNYGIGCDGRSGVVVDECDRSWCSSSPSNDNRAITIECASDAFYPYAVNANVWKSLVELCADICKRHGKNKVLWLGSKEATLAYSPKANEMVLSAHRWFDNKSCPGDYLYSRYGQLAKEVNQKLSGAPAEPFKAYQGQVNADDGLNCRTAPVSGAVLKTYPDGTVLTITKEDGNWGYCGEGWVCLDYINKIASAKDPAAKEETIMDGKTFKKMYDEINPTYNTLEEVPSYWRADIKELVDKGVIAGTGGGKLGLTKSDCKAAVIAKRIREKL